MSLKPILYYTLRSPPCRAVMMTAAAIGKKLELRNMNLKAGDHLNPKFFEMNPLLTIPVLDDNGVAVTDSHLISGYLVDKYASNDSLYPRDPLKRREVDARLFFNCGHIFPRLRFIIEPIIHFGVDEIPEDRLIYMTKAYDGLERCLANASYLCGENMTIADLCCAASISSSILFAPIDEEKFPNLKLWIERISQLPYYAENEEGAQVLRNFVLERLNENKNAKLKAN